VSANPRIASIKVWLLKIAAAALIIHAMATYRWYGVRWLDYTRGWYKIQVLLAIFLVGYAEKMRRADDRVADEVNRDNAARWGRNLTPPGGDTSHVEASAAEKPCEVIKRSEEESESPQ
jgi:hypothetical protein